MTREEFEELVLFVRQHRSKGHPPYEAIIQLADERDAVIKRVEEAERQLAAIMEMRERDAPIWDRLGDVAKTLLSTDAAKLAGQRDRALALLRDELAGEKCVWTQYDQCRYPESCWEHRRRALLAEVDG